VKRINSPIVAGGAAIGALGTFIWAFSQERGGISLPSISGLLPTAKFDQDDVDEDEQDKFQYKKPKIKDIDYGSSLDDDDVDEDFK
jgi:hypothetical protein